MTKRTTFQSVIDALLDGSKPFPAGYLQMFSDLPTPDLGLLQESWEMISLNRRQTLLEDLRDLAVTDTLTNFDQVGSGFLDDPTPEIRILAIRLLWESEEQGLIPVYLRLLKKDPSAEVRAASATALGLFVLLGELEELDPKVLQEIEKALLKSMAGKSSSLVQRAALESLGFSSRPEVQNLIENAIHQKDPDWEVSALVAMGHSSDEQWEKHILSRLRHENDDIRSAAIDAAGEIGLPGAREPLLDRLEDEEDLEVRHSLIQALSKIGGEGVRSAIDELLDLEDDEEEIEFLEDALEILIQTEGTGLDMFDIDPGEDIEGISDHSLTP